ncbi:choice-of-anchor Q domain-containing protein [Verrucomicrobiota bacterium]
MNACPAAGLCLLAVTSAACADRFVWTNSPSPGAGHTTWDTAAHEIQTAVDAATAGEIVRVTNGTYALSGEIIIAKNIRLQSVNGAAATRIDGADAVRCMHFVSGSESAVVEGFTITHGRSRGTSPADRGGGVYMDASGNSAVRNCVITRNHAAVGGGIFFAECNGRAESCVIVSNTVSDRGGGAYCHYGGSFEDCTIRGNSAAGNGGGVIAGAHNLGDVWLSNCVISDNEAGDQGGGVFCDRGVLTRCVVSGNTARGAATHGGGGVFVGLSGRIRNCLIIGNAASGGGSSRGGGVYLNGGGDGLQNCTIVRNTAGVGGGVCFTGNAARNCIIYYNQVPNPVYGHNYYFHFGGQCLYTCTTPKPAGDGNVDGDPQFEQAGSGYGPSFTAGDYNLLPLSPCVDSGVLQAWMAAGIDIEGKPRIHGEAVDMGAYEHNPEWDPPLLGGVLFVL